MSETVHYRGKLKKVEKLANESLEKQCERIAKACNHTGLKECQDSWEELICDELYEKYIVVGDDMYEVLENSDVSIEYNLYTASKNTDGTISYEVMYYNGGCCFEEAISNALDNMKG